MPSLLSSLLRRSETLPRGLQVPGDSHREWAWTQVNLLSTQFYFVVACMALQAGRALNVCPHPLQRRLGYRHFYVTRH